MHYRFGFFLLLSFLVIPAAAQTTGLVAQVGPGPVGRPVVTIVNNHAAVARFYIVQCTVPGATSGQSTLQISHVGFGGPPFAVPPQATQSIGCPPSTLAATVQAAIYDDGYAEGDAADLANLRLAQQNQLTQVTQALKILNNATSSGGLNAPNLVATFFQLAVQEDATVTSAPPGHFNRWLAQAIIANRVQPLPTYVNNLIGLLNSYSASLQQPVSGVTPQ